MNKRILLISPPYVKDYMRNARCDFVSLSGTQWFPVLLGYAGAFLESKGFSVKLVDAPAYGLSFGEVEKIIDEYKPDLLAVYAGDKSRDADIEFGDKVLDKRNILAVFVGPYFAIEPEYFLQKSRNIHYGIIGEFEYPLWEFMRGGNLAAIRNLIWKSGNGIQRNPSRPYLNTSELDAIPFVSEFFSRHLDFKYYRTPSEPYPFMDIMTGRGCIWGVCSFCLWVNTYIKGKVYNCRSIANVMDELEFIEKKLPAVKSVMVQDDTFAAPRAKEFCAEKLKRGIKLPWSCYARADIDFETLQLMKKAGCLNLHVGFESANNEVLKKIRKGLSREQMTEFARNAKKAGLRLHGDFLIGLPGETKASIRDLIDWAYAIRPYTAQFQIFIPFKSTPVYDELDKNGWIKNGRVSYPELSSQDIEALSKQAYRRFYLNFPYAWEVLQHPINLFFKKMPTIGKAIASIFWKKLDIR